MPIFPDVDEQGITLSCCCHSLIISNVIMESTVSATLFTLSLMTLFFFKKTDPTHKRKN